MVTKAPPTISFNVGGSVYQVSCNTLQRYPESMLAKLVSEVWKPQEPSAPIFIDRDGSRFQFVLDFLRDGKVHLPASVSAEALRADFAYYGLPDGVKITRDHLGFSHVFRITEYLNAIKSKAVAAEALKQALNKALSTNSKEVTICDQHIQVSPLPVDEAQVRELIEELGLAISVTRYDGRSTVGAPSCRFTLN